MAFTTRRPLLPALPLRLLRRYAAPSLVLVLALCGFAAAATAEEFTPAQTKAIESIVRDYLMKHPEVLIDVLQAAEDKMKSEAHEKVAKALSEHRHELLEDPDSPVAGNLKGDVTLVEFFDYRCPYCKQVEPSLERLIAQDHQLRVVYKEFPVLGPASTVAARAALAARKQGKYAEFHTAMMAAKGQISDATVFQVAGSVGVDVERLKRDMAAPDIDRALKANFTLADALDIHGTPAFIVGDQIIPGAISLDGLKQLIEDHRAAK